LPHYAGINTFLKAPYLEDVRQVGNYDVAIVGVPHDSGTTYRPGTRFGPQGIRKISALYTPYNFEFGVDLREQITLCDVGDIFTIPANNEKSFDQISKGIAHIFSSGAFPIILGGDHSIGFPTVRGVCRHLGDKKVGIIHFDRHVDTQETDLDERMHTCPWFHATNMANAPAKNLVQLGIGGWQVPRQGVKVCRERGTNILTVTDIMEMGLDAAADFAIEKATDGTDCVWISFDIDCIDAGLRPRHRLARTRRPHAPRSAVSAEAHHPRNPRLRHRSRRSLPALRRQRHDRPHGHPRHLRHHGPSGGLRSTAPPTAEAWLHPVRRRIWAWIRCGSEPCTKPT
jgi:agmatinase